LKRRLYRLAHISFFGLGAVNLFFYFTALRLPAITPVIVIASWGFIIGAISMPICCLLMAHFPRTHLLFSIPVASLLVAGALTLISLVQVAHSPAQTFKPPRTTLHVSRFTHHASRSKKLSIRQP